MTGKINQHMGVHEWALLIILGGVWGATMFFTEIALVELQPFTLAFGRVLIAGLALWGAARLFGHKLPFGLAAWGPFFILGALNNALPFSLIMWGQTEITGSLASILNATTPLSAVIIAHFLTRDEKLSVGKIFGIFLGLAGVAVMIGLDALQGLGLGILAQFAVIAAGISYSFAGVYGRRFQGTPPIIVASGQLIASSFLLLPCALLVDQFWTLPNLLPATWAALIAMALLSTALAYLIYFQLLASSGATNVLLVTFLVPVSAIFLGFVFLGERLEPQHIFGMVLIALGLAAIDGRAIKIFHTTNKNT